MQMGFNLPISGPMSSPESMTRIAQQGEALGYDYLTLTDHLMLPNLRVPGYPYSESGEFFGEGPERRHEQLSAAAFIAAKTSRIRLVLAVMSCLIGRPCSPPKCCRRSMSLPAGGWLSGSAPAGCRPNLMRSSARLLPRAAG
jgi:hypothetical protein